MGTEETSLIYVDIYQGRIRKALGRPQTWRWRAINGHNHKKMATSGEAYTNRDDALDAITALFGTNSNVYLRQKQHGNLPLRLAGAV